jgi:hypothetical protein
MTNDVRYQRNCFFASPEYTESFRGKYIYIYEGKGSLRLTTNSLCLEDCPRPIEIPFQSIKSISLGRFPLVAKPVGLSRLTVCFTVGDETRAIHLVPHESSFALYTSTNALVASWLQTLGGVEELAGRVQPHGPEQEASRSSGTRVALVALLLGALLIPVVVFGLVGWYARHPAEMPIAPPALRLG